MVLAAVKEAARRLLEMREKEGLALAADLSRRVGILEERIEDQAWPGIYPPFTGRSSPASSKELTDGWR